MHAICTFGNLLFNTFLKYNNKNKVSEPVLYGALVCRFKRIAETLFCPDKFKKLTKRYKRVRHINVTYM